MNFITLDKMPVMPGGHFFNDPEFHALKKGQGKFFALEEDGKIIARLAFYVDGTAAVSGFQAPFGSIDYIANPGKKKLSWFLSKIIDDLKMSGVRQMRLALPPGYSNLLTPWEEVLHGFGFTPEAVEVNQHLVVDKMPFERKISQKERNKLNRAMAEGYEWARLGSEDIPAAFALITATHGRKNYPITLGKEEFKVAHEQIPNRYLLFGLYDKELLIAVVASVVVSEAVLYNFYHADHEDYRPRSPLVMLIGEAYAYCQKNQISILDLGISSVQGQLNKGLFRFKQNLGCLTTDKQTMVLNL